ncbi:MAG: hypothetical protein EZS28_000610 [Streblomastix strix]|uniref:Uncharacterized protein n=1 Tax=Streblomastix strix TaxID=222440 RepID=A0A5J4XBJ3_9EUKA|nr:MAG: hypothetical protein EZS28_000610 [Streblomastix strix]
MSPTDSQVQLQGTTMIISNGKMDDKDYGDQESQTGGESYNKDKAGVYIESDQESQEDMEEDDDDEEEEDDVDEDDEIEVDNYEDQYDY